MVFEDLEICTRFVALSPGGYLVVKDLKKYGLKAQITWSCLSTSSNIAQDIERKMSEDRLNFSTYSQGSYAEFRSQAYIEIKINYIPKDIGQKWTQQSKKISAIIIGLSKSISNSTNLIFQPFLY